MHNALQARKRENAKGVGRKQSLLGAKYAGLFSRKEQLCMRKCPLTLI